MNNNEDYLKDYIEYTYNEIGSYETWRQEYYIEIFDTVDNI